MTVAYLVLDGVAITDVGRTDDSCPNCGAELARRPARKTPCPHCGDFIHKRTRPLDGREVLVRAGDLTDVEAQWAAYAELKRFVRELSWRFPEFAPLYEDLHAGRRGHTPIDWPALSAAALRPPEPPAGGARDAI